MNFSFSWFKELYLRISNLYDKGGTFNLVNSLLRYIYVCSYSRISDNPFMVFLIWFMQQNMFGACIVRLKEQGLCILLWRSFVEERSLGRWFKENAILQMIVSSVRVNTLFRAWAEMRRISCTLIQDRSVDVLQSLPIWWTNLICNGLLTLWMFVSVLISRISIVYLTQLCHIDNGSNLIKLASSKNRSVSIQRCRLQEQSLFISFLNGKSLFISSLWLVIYPLESDVLLMQLGSVFS